MCHAAKKQRKNAGARNKEKTHTDRQAPHLPQARHVAKSGRPGASTLYYHLYLNTLLSLIKEPSLLLIRWQKLQSCSLIWVLFSY